MPACSSVERKDFYIPKEQEVRTAVEIEWSAGEEGSLNRADPLTRGAKGTVGSHPSKAARGRGRPRRTFLERSESRVGRDFKKSESRAGKLPRTATTWYLPGVHFVDRLVGADTGWERRSSAFRPDLKSLSKSRTLVVWEPCFGRARAGLFLLGEKTRKITSHIRQDRNPKKTFTSESSGALGQT